MQYILVWVEWLIIALLFVSFGTAISQKINRQFLRLGCIIIFVLFPGLIFSAFSFLSWYLNSQDVRPSWLMTYFYSLLALYLFAAFIVLFRFHRKSVGMHIGSLWSWKKNGVYFLIALLANITTFYLVENHQEREQKKRFESIELSIEKYLLEPVSPDKNAAPLYKEAAGLVGDETSSYLEKANDIDFDASAPKCSLYLSGYENILKILHKAASLPQCHFHFELEKIIDMNGVEITHIKKFAFLLIMEARYFAVQGEFDKSIENIAVIQKMALHFYRFPGSLLNCAYARGLEMWAFKGFENVFHDFSSKYGCPKLHPSVVDTPDTEDILRAIEMEEAFMMVQTLNKSRSLLESFLIVDLWSRDPSELYWYEKPLEWILDRLYYMFLYQSDLNNYLHITQQTKLLAHAGIPEGLIRANELMEQSDKGIGDIIGLGQSIGPPGYFELTYRIYAYRRIETTALAANAFCSDKGKYPDNLEELIPEYLPEIPVDPFDKNGNPIRLKPHENGILIYSIGVDQSDDGGLTSKESSENYDIVFHLGEKPVKDKKVKRGHK